MTDAASRDDSAITIVLAEYAALRAEIVARLGAQATLVGVALTAIGVVVGVVLTGKGSRELLLVVPILAPALGLFFVEHMRQMALLGLYIRDSLWPLLRAQVSDVAIPSWEHAWAGYNDRGRHRRNVTYFTFLLLAGAPPGAIFFLSSTVALGFTASLAFDEVGHAAIWLLGCVLTALFALSAVFVSNSYKHDSLETLIACRN